jgi:hypothetical protein
MPVQQCPSTQNSASVLHSLRKPGMITTGSSQVIQQLSKHDLSPTIFFKQMNICSQEGYHLISRNNTFVAHMCKLGS